jgi:hypothetical protein
MLGVPLRGEKLLCSLPRRPKNLSKSRLAAMVVGAKMGEFTVILDVILVVIG